ncbi:MAG: hypothetical protein JXA74_07555, partial [Anaerolineae bacterium]|nr:hypothetical protein [Anaerolineae bacterium]
GRHYVRTLRAWLERLDAQRASALRILAEAYGPAEARRRLAHWRLFFLICEGIFRYRRGSEYFVGHYLFDKPAGVPSAGGELEASP